MKRTNILLSAALIVVAILAGCTAEGAYPAFPQSVLLTQKGDFIKGQDFDASKFEVLVTYLDGSSRVVKDAILTTGVDTTKGVQGGESVSVNVGTDYNGEAVTYSGEISKVYTIDYITAITKETSFAVEDDGSATPNPELFTVTAYYNGTKSVVLGANNYYVTVTADKSVENYGEATEVPATATVWLKGNLAAANDWKSCTVTGLTATKDSVAPTTVKELTGISSTDMAIPKFNYASVADLPAIEDYYGDIVLSYKDSNNISQTKKADLIANDFDIIYTNQYGEELTDKIVSLDFAGAEGEDQTSVYIQLVVDGENVGEPKAVKLADTSIVVYYDGNGYPANTEYEDINLNVDDFRVYLTVGEETTNISAEITEKDLFWAAYSEGITADTTNTAMPSYEEGQKNGRYVSVNYNGVTDVTNAVVLSQKAIASISTVTFDVTDVTGPAKQYLNAVPAVDVSQIKEFKVTMSDSSTSTLTAADFEWAFYTEANDATSKLALVEGEVDLSNVSELYVGATYNKVTYYSSTTVKTVTSVVATGLELSASYGDVALYGESIEWTINLVNDNGTVQKNVTGYTPYVVVGSESTKIAALPDELGTAGSYKVAYVYNDSLLESNVVEIPAGTSYFNEITATDLKVEYKGEKLYISEQLSSVSASDFEVTTTSSKYVGEGEAPKLTVANIQLVSGETIDATNKILVTVKYVGSDLKEHSVVKEVSLTGTSWVEGTPALKLGDVVVTGKTAETATEVIANTYTFDAKKDGLEAHGTGVGPTYSVTNVSGTASGTGSTLTIAADGVAKVTITYTNKEKEQVVEFFVKGVAAPEEEPTT